MRRAFPAFMLDVEIGGSLKLVGLTDGEWRAHVGGVLPIAAKSPIRGRLLIGDLRAGPEHVAAQARVRPIVARRALEKLRGVGVIVNDLEYDCERVHDFEAWNPAPKVDRTAAERQQRRRDRLRDEAAVTDASRRDSHGVTPEKEKGSRRTTPLTPQGGNDFPVEPSGKRGRDVDLFLAGCKQTAERLLPHANPLDAVAVVRGAITSGGATTDEQVLEFVTAHRPDLMERVA